MKKDAYYFPHYCNARHDRKIRRIRKELGVEGYGIFFMLLEVLREQTDFRYPVDDLDLLADEFGTSEQKISVVVSNYGLFTVDEKNKFFSPKLVFYLEPYFKRVERAKKAAEVRWADSRENADAMLEHRSGNANKGDKGDKGKKKKESIFASISYLDKIGKGELPREVSIIKDSLSKEGYAFSEKDIILQALHGADYCRSHGKKYLNYRSALKNRLRNKEKWDNENKAQRQTSGGSRF